MNENRKNITSGDILEMMARAGLKPQSELNREHREPIVSISGEDVEWGSHAAEPLRRKEKAA